jgi:DNA-binding PucR family transcriptional regulator
VVAFDDLGLYRLLHAGHDDTEIEQYVREWLGRLLDYDSRHHTELTNTLFHYLECGGNYAATADALVIHRSTLRYRLRRIKDVGDVDLHDVDSRLNLHVAARAWHMLTARS